MRVLDRHNDVLRKLEVYIDKNYINKLFTVMEATVCSKVYEKEVYYSDECYDLSRSLLNEIEDRIDNITPFSRLLLKHIDNSGFKTDAEFYKVAGIDRRHFAKMKNDNYIPSKQTIFMIALALKLHYAEAVDLLEVAGYAFSKSSKFDIIMEFFFKEKIYDLMKINSSLEYFGEKALGVIK